MRAKSASVALLALLAPVARSAAPAPAVPAWQPIVAGAEYAFVDGFDVVRVDPKIARLVAYAAKDGDGHARTAAQWAEEKKLAVVINAGMFLLDDDMSTHEGYFRAGDRVSQPATKSAYKSVLEVAADGAARIRDCDGGAACKGAPDARVVAQNLRLIESKDGVTGHGVWAENHRRWSEAAAATDDAGRILFLFSRAPLSMKAWNDKVLALGLGVIRAQHLEGGPEASLTIRPAPAATAPRLDRCGSFETGFNENDDNHRQWPIPNVLAVVAAD